MRRYPCIARRAMQGLLILQPEAFFLFAHRAFLDGLGEGLFLGALLLAACGVTCLTAIEGQGWLAVVQHAAELFCGDLRVFGHAVELSLNTADELDCAWF